MEHLVDQHIDAHPRDDALDHLDDQSLMEDL